MPARGRDQRTGCCTELQRDMGGRMASVCCQSWARAALLMHPKKRLCVTRVCLAHPSTHCTLAWAYGALHFLGSPCWQGTCLSTLGSFL